MPAFLCPLHCRPRCQVYCFRMQLMEPECLYNGRGMTVWEFEHYKVHRLKVENSSDAEPQLGFNAIKLEETVEAWKLQASSNQFQSFERLDGSPSTCVGFVAIVPASLAVAPLRRGSPMQGGNTG